MSRYEIAELERELRTLDEPAEALGSGIELTDESDRVELVKHIPEFQEYQRQLKNLIPIRNSVIKRYFDKFKMQKNKREDILSAAEASENFIKGMLGREYVHFTDAIPEIKEFILELEKKEI